MNILPGMVLSPIQNNSILVERVSRVLRVDTHADKVTIINIEPTTKHSRKYFTGPKHLRLSQVLKEISCHGISLQTTGVKLRSDVLASDDALNAKYGMTPCASVKIRKERFAIIKSMVRNPCDYSQFCDDQIRNELIDKYCKENLFSNSLKKKVQQIVFQFLAEGSTPNALTPFLALRGGRGKVRQQKTKLGRPNAPTKSGIKQHEGFKMSEIDRQRCGFAFRNFLLRGVTIEVALRVMWKNFYSDHFQDANGKAIFNLLPECSRPSISQFKRWGQLYSGEEYWKKQLNKQQLSRIDRAIIGHANDEVFAVGQLGAIDSTTTDTQFVSITDRLKRVGLAHRILIVDSMYGYIPGFYMGINAASMSTVKLALLHASSEKADWLESLGLASIISANDWIPMQFGNLIADNTDVRNAVSMDELTQLGIGIKFIPTHRSDMNSIVETAHHSLHRLVDHKQPGTTRGRRLERGDEKPDLSARMTIIEGIRETARAIHLHNTIPLNIPLTLEIRTEIINRGLAVNRLNLTRMAIEKGRVHASLSRFEELICKFGQIVSGTFTPKGVKLHRSDISQRAFIEPISFISKESKILDKFREAKANRRVSPDSYDEEFIFNPYDLRRIYYRDVHTGEIFQLDRLSPDVESDEYTLPDYISAMEQDAIHKHLSDDQKQQQLTRFEDELSQTVITANYEYNKAKDSSPPIAKSRISRDKKHNRLQEKQQLEYGFVKSNHLNTPSNELVTNHPTNNLFEKNILDEIILGRPE